MNPLDIIRRASRAGIDLNVRGGKLYIASGVEPIPAELLGAIRDHKPAIIHELTVWPQIATLRYVTLARCLPLTLEDLTDAERTEAESLAAELDDAGGLGQFVIDLMHTWNELTEIERLQAAWCWESAVTVPGVSIAA